MQTRPLVASKSPAVAPCQRRWNSESGWKDLLNWRWRRRFRGSHDWKSHKDSFKEHLDYGKLSDESVCLISRATFSDDDTQGQFVNKPTTRGKNISHLQLTLLDEMDGDDATRLMSKVEQLMHELPDPQVSFPPKQGLLLGLVQSGKTVALTTAIAMAADNGYKCFVVLTSDNLWLYQQTTSRLKKYLQGMQIEGKRQWDGQLLMVGNLRPEGSGVVLVTTKNASVLRSLNSALDSLAVFCGGELPPALIVDDEADQASLDTQTSRRAKDPSIAPGTISSLIEQLRHKFSKHVFLQVTATPQALFLQDSSHPQRPEFTVLIEPGKGYIGGNTFFSLDLGFAEPLIRHINQSELDQMLTRRDVYVPSSLWDALCAFFVAATIKYLIHETFRREGRGEKYVKDPKYSFLCHISQKKTDHQRAYDAINQSHQRLVNGLSSTASAIEHKDIRNSLGNAYDDILLTLKPNSTVEIPEFERVLTELKDFIVGTEVQIMNSDREENQPRYDRRYNILIGGNKLSRGVTIPNLIVTYYGRKAKSPNMDTVLQHARMYGYRENDLNVTRLYLTPEIENRFRLINESEQSLRSVIEHYPGKEYQGIQIGPGVKATRSNVLNPNNIGSYGAGRTYFPYRPLTTRVDIQEVTERINRYIAELVPKQEQSAVKITIDQAIELVSATKSVPSSGGLWDTDRIVASLEKLKARHNNTAYLVARLDRNLGPNKDGLLRAVLSGERGSYPGDISFANPAYPTLFMFRINGEKWNGHPFWVPVVRFPDGQYAILFNFDRSQ